MPRTRRTRWLPESIVVDIEGATAGTQIHASALALPEGVTLVTDGETLVVNVAAMISQEALDAELADAESEAGIEHEEPVGEETAEAAAATDEAAAAE